MYAEVMLVEAVTVIRLRVQDYELDRHCHTVTEQNRLEDPALAGATDSV